MRWTYGLLVLCLGISIPARAQEEDQAKPAEWIADPRTGCKVWNNYPQDGDEISWDGPCVDGLAHGKGVLRWFADGENYETDEGEFRRGKMHGHVIARDDTGTFEGEFRDNKPDGRGTLRTSDGDEFTGIWKKGCFQDGDRRALFYTTPEECGFSTPPGRSI
jgi:hypothetical protein